MNPARIIAVCRMAIAEAMCLGLMKLRCSSATTVKDKDRNTLPPIETEAQALKDLGSMPIYFASSYSLVKPYVNGFDSNVLDAPSLKTVHINTNWTNPKPAR